MPQVSILDISSTGTKLRSESPCEFVRVVIVMPGMEDASWYICSHCDEIRGKVSWTECCDRQSDQDNAADEDGGICADQEPAPVSKSVREPGISDDPWDSHEIGSNSVN